MDLAFMAEIFVKLLEGVPLTLKLAFSRSRSAPILALVLALMRMSGVAALDWLARGYVFVFRGTPLLVQIFLIYYGLGQFRPTLQELGVWWFFREPYWCALTRADAQHRGLCERDHPRRPAGGAACPGRGGPRLRHVAASCCSAASSSRSRSGRRSPAYGSEIILMVKATSLASIITMMEVTGIAHKLISQTFRAVEIFICAGAIYLILNFLVTRVIHGLEWWLSPHLRQPPEVAAAGGGGACMTAPSPAPAAVAIRDLRKSFGPLEVLKGVSMSAADGEVISILGASGSGKSTMLRCINMLEVPDAGEIAIGGETIALEKDRRGRMRAGRRRPGRPHPHRSVAMVFQSFNLWSHMTVLENVIEAPVHVQKRPRAECRRRGRGAPRQGRHRREAQPLPVPSLRRPAAARRDRPRARHAPAGDAVRRADLGARPRARRRGPARHARARRGRPHHAGRHPRDGLRPRRVEPRRVPASGRRRGGRPAGQVFGAPKSERFRQFISSGAEPLPEGEVEAARKRRPGEGLRSHRDRP